MFVQVVAVTLLPAALVFLLLILNEPAFMGDRVNTRTQNTMNWSIVIVVSVMSTLLGIQTLFPDLFQ
jgi:Mn2+/Fe2+ NRAMP family transporter